MTTGNYTIDLAILWLLIAAGFALVVTGSTGARLEAWLAAPDPEEVTASGLEARDAVGNATTHPRERTDSC